MFRITADPSQLSGLKAHTRHVLQQIVPFDIIMPGALKHKHLKEPHAYHPTASQASLMPDYVATCYWMTKLGTLAARCTDMQQRCGACCPWCKLGGSKHIIKCRQCRGMAAHNEAECTAHHPDLLLTTCSSTRTSSR